MFDLWHETFDINKSSTYKWLSFKVIIIKLFCIAYAKSEGLIILWQLQYAPKQTFQHLSLINPMYFQSKRGTLNISSETIQEL